MTKLADFGVDEKEMVEKTEFFIKNKIWFDKNYVKLKEGYGNKFVAIYNQEVIDSDESKDALIKRILKKFPSLKEILIDYVSSKELILIL